MKKTVKIPALVVDEAKKLKQYATSEEKAALDFQTFNPENAYMCIYGQLTGNCYSTRASELIVQCAKRVYVAEDNLEPRECKKLNGKPKAGSRGFGYTKYWSPIEKFIQIA